MRRADLIGAGGIGVLEIVAHVELAVLGGREPAGKPRRRAQMLAMHEQAAHRTGTAVQVFVGAEDRAIDAVVVEAVLDRADGMAAVEAHQYAPRMRRIREPLHVQILFHACPGMHVANVLRMRFETIQQGLQACLQIGKTLAAKGVLFTVSYQKAQRALTVTEINNIYSAGVSGVIRAPVIASTGLNTNGQFYVNLQGLPGKNFALHSSSDLVHWFVTGNIANVNGTNSYTDLNTPNTTKKFYQVSSGY